MPPPIPVDTSSLRALFTKPYGAPAPSEAQWRELYADDVHFQDPTQEKRGIAAYIAAQEGLLRRCDDVYLTTGAIANRLFLSTHTIDSHREKLKRKLNAKNAGELTRAAVQWLLEKG